MTAAEDAGPAATDVPSGDGPVARRRMGAAAGAGRTATGAVKGPASVGAICLDFLATVDSSDGHDVDLMSGPGELQDWLVSHGLPVPAGGVTEEDLTAARVLRDAVDGVARALLAGGEAAVQHVRTINTCAQHRTPVFLLRPGGRRRTVVEEIDVASSLSVLARDSIHVFADSDLSRLRECARPGCARLFVDRSPSGRRRWCAMKGCGEIVASATYRRRRAARGPS
jgi:predicted RNA-binding Zn ribbon-like protein